MTGLYVVEPTIDFVEIAQLVDNADASHQHCPGARGRRRADDRVKNLKVSDRTSPSATRRP